MTEMITKVTDSFDATRTHIASKLRQARKSAGHSLDGLAERAGVSKGALVQLEQGQGNPSVAILCRVAAALEISLADLVAADPADGASPTPFDPENSGRIVWRGLHSGTARLVIGTAGPDMVELWEWQMYPDEYHESVAHSEGAREILLTHSGKLGVSAGAWKGTVGAGQGLLLTADVAHSYWCEGRKPVRFRMYVSERPSR